ncbi:MAG: Lrp/AsnC family transcriptional regulator [Kineosporiaceae bacterium]|nr:Lrp/AsnC family transcriptional regulator [Aeromicrobium sp.]
MIDSGGITERDLALVDALQIAPRASWAAVARATSTSPVTAARRWRHLVDSGAAWVTGAPGVSVWNAQCVAYVDIRCTPGESLAIAEILAQDRHALSVELTTGGADVFATVAAADPRALSRYMLERVEMIPGIIETRTRISTHLYRDGSHWRVHALPREDASVLRAHPQSQTTSYPSVLPHIADIDRAILVQLGLDGRSSYTTIAANAEVSEATARRRVARLLGSGAVLLRAEVAAHLAGWPVQVTLSVDAPTSQLVETVRRIARIRQVRLCATLAGNPPIVVTAWLRDVEALHRFETALVKDVPNLTVVERLITLRTVKRMGRVLDEDGRAVGAVPMDVWTDPLTMA